MIDITNKEEKIFRQMSKEEQAALKAHHESGGVVEALHFCEDYKPVPTPKWYGDRVYRAVLPKLSDEPWPDDPRVTCRVVSPNGSAFYGTYKEVKFNGCRWFGIGEGRWLTRISSEPGEYDATDWRNSAEYRDPPKPKLRPWKPHEFIGKYIGVKNETAFYPPYIHEDGGVGTAYTPAHKPRWWLKRGDCLRPDGTIGPCGEEVER